MTTRFQLIAGEALHVREMSGERASVLCGKAFPPGSTLEFCTCDTERVRFKVKVRSCTREPDGAAFLISGRFVDLTRGARELLMRSA